MNKVLVLQLISVLLPVICGFLMGYNYSKCGRRAGTLGGHLDFLGFATGGLGFFLVASYLRKYEMFPRTAITAMCFIFICCTWLGSRGLDICRKRLALWNW